VARSRVTFTFNFTVPSPFSIPVVDIRLATLSSSDTSLIYIDVIWKIAFPMDRLAGRCLCEAFRQMVRQFGISKQNSLASTFSCLFLSCLLQQHSHSEQQVGQCVTLVNANECYHFNFETNVL
jgi:hypothetical protein